MFSICLPRGEYIRYQTEPLHKQNHILSSNKFITYDFIRQEQNLIVAYVQETLQIYRSHQVEYGIRFMK